MSQQRKGFPVEFKGQLNQNAAKLQKVKCLTYSGTQSQNICSSEYSKVQFKEKKLQDLKMIQLEFNGICRML